MKDTLKTKIIIYDDACPMCKWYTNLFVQLGLLMPENRLAFSKISSSLFDKVDIDRARHEIPLFDKRTKEVIYGLDAMFYILASYLPILKPLFSFKPFELFWRFIYKIITYNRRIIAGTTCDKNCFDCGPDRNISYRAIYVLGAIIFSIMMTLGLAKVIPSIPKLIVLSSCGIGWLLLLISGFTFTQNQKWDYWGHISTIMIIGVLLLLPTLLLNLVSTVPLPFLALNILLSFFTMFLEHNRRRILIGLSTKVQVNFIVFLWTGVIISQLLNNLF